MPSCDVYFFDNDAKKHFLLLLVYRTAVAKTYVIYWSGPNTAGNPLLRPPPASGAFRCHRIGARRVLSLEREPRLTLFSSTNEQRRIRHHITCFSSSLVYLTQCNKCNVQYIGETKPHLSDRFGEHTEAQSKKPSRHR